MPPVSLASVRVDGACAARVAVWPSAPTNARPWITHVAKLELQASMFLSHVQGSLFKEHHGRYWGEWEDNQAAVPGSHQKLLVTI